MRKIFISAGDPSGDIHCARMMRELSKIYNDIHFIGIGGEQMAKAGLVSIVPISEISVVGFWEVAKKYLFFRELMEKCKRILREENISAFIPVDYPGFNIPLATYAKGLGIPVVYYIAPQLWAWGKNRAAKLYKCVDKLLVVFPFEVEYFSKFGIETTFVGHPLLDDESFAVDMHGLSDREDLIAFLPGSRKQEIIKHLPIIDKIADSIRLALPGYKTAIAISGNVDLSIYHSNLATSSQWIFTEDSRELMKRSKAGIVKTGTSTLEAALCGMPFVMFYKSSALTYSMGKHLVNLPYISLTNILVNDMIVEEYIQNDIKPDKIAQKIKSLIDNPSEYSSLQNKFNDIRHLLGSQGAAHNAAIEIGKKIG
jgi:lipid-A-disaccharide synthase